MALVRPGSTSAAASVAGLSRAGASPVLGAISGCAVSHLSHRFAYPHAAGRNLLRECMGVEPTTERGKRPINGFEDREDHRILRTLRARSIGHFSF